MIPRRHYDSPMPFSLPADAAILFFAMPLMRRHGFRWRHAAADIRRFAGAAAPPLMRITQDPAWFNVIFFRCFWLIKFHAVFVTPSTPKRPLISAFSLFSRMPCHFAQASLAMVSPTPQPPERRWQPFRQIIDFAAGAASCRHWCFSFQCQFRFIFSSLFRFQIAFR